MISLNLHTIRSSRTVLLFLSLVVQIRGDCGSPPIIEHTLPAEETSGVPGQTIVYSCDRSIGYYDVPGKSRTITCQDDFTWSRIPEFCARACAVPDRLLFAEPKPEDINKDIFLPGSVVSFSCRPGYVRTPSTKNSITCLDNVTWSAAETFCQRKSCGNPGEVDNGEMQATDFLFSSRVTYVCNEGYQMETKRNYRECLANGDWSGALPVCTVTICPAPDTTPNGSFSPVKDEYSYLDSVTYSCSRGLEIVGTASISCTSQGEWSAIPPTCKAVNCPDPVVEYSRKLSGFVGPYSLNSAVRFECIQGRFMKGSDSIICNIDSEWKPALPQCLIVDCPDPVVKDARKLSGLTGPYSLNSAVRFECIAGHVMKGSDSITCNIDSQWEPAFPECLMVSCGNPGEIVNADLSSSNFLYGFKAKYTCKEGYTITSNVDYKECQADGTWSTANIVCSALCDPLPTNLYPVVLEDTSVRRYTNGTTVHFKCSQGFERDHRKNNSITCIGKSWSTLDKFCSHIC